MGIFELKKKCEIINERGVTRSLHVTFSVKEEPIEVFTFYCNDNSIFTGSEHQLRDLYFILLHSQRRGKYV